MEDDDDDRGSSAVSSSNGLNSRQDDDSQNKVVIANGKRNHHQEEDEVDDDNTNNSSSNSKKRRLDDATNSNSVSNGVVSSTKSGGSIAAESSTPQQEPEKEDDNNSNNKPEETKRRSQRQRTATGPTTEESNSDEEQEEDDNVPVKEIHMSRKEREEEERIRKLDSTTLGLLRDALNDQSLHCHLNDDEMMHFLSRVDREARHLSHLQGGSHPEDTDGSLLEELVAEAEDTALGREVFHKAIATVNKSHVGSTDRRTVEWVRRASGLGKSKMENLVRENAEAGRMTKRHGKAGRYTRNMARNTREERREKGLGILLSAVDDLEGVLGPYPAYKPKKRKRTPSEKVAQNEAAAIDMAEAQKTPKVTNRKKPNENKRKNENKVRPAKESSARANGGRAAAQRNEEPKAKPTWVDIRPPQDNVIEAFELPACTEDSAIYAKKSLRLVNSMTEAHLLWARYEFFYSDVDRAWFGRNEFVRKAARLGIRPGSLLTQLEWNAVRRQIRGKPRRFSRRFVESEYANLQNYRVHVRMLQTNPDPSFATRLGFDYEVPKPISVGAPISAVAQRKPGAHVSSPVQRGSVLSFSHGFYIVQLTGGIALLPDFMVARHGPTDVLIPAPRTSLVGMREAVVEECGPTSPTASWSGPGPLDYILRAGNDSKVNGSKPDPNRDSNEWYLKPEVPEITEKELLATVMANAEMALRRKNTILEAIEALDTVGLFKGTHKIVEETKTSVQKHLNWLLDSLDEANESYKIAREYVEHLTEMPAMDKVPTLGSPLDRNYEQVDIPMPRRDSLADAHAARLLLHASAASSRSVAELRFNGDIAPEMAEVLRSVGQLLLVSSTHGSSSNAGHEGSAPAPLVGRAIQTAVAASVEPLCQMFSSPPPVPDIGNFETHLYQNALHARQQALEALMEAANVLNIELTAASREG